MTQEEYQREKEWAMSDVGKLFLRYEVLSQNYAIIGERDDVSDKRLREMDEKTRTARREFLQAIRGW